MIIKTSTKNKEFSFHLIFILFFKMLFKLNKMNKLKLFKCDKLVIMNINDIQGVYTCYSKEVKHLFSLVIQGRNSFIISEIDSVTLQAKLGFHNF